MPATPRTPETFTNHFDPRIGKVAVDVLESAVFRVAVPAQAARQHGTRICLAGKRALGATAVAAAAGLVGRRLRRARIH